MTLILGQSKQEGIWRPPSLPMNPEDQWSRANQTDNSISGLRPDKFKSILKKLPLGDKPSVKILQDLNISVNSKPKSKSIIQKKYPGAP